MPTSGDAAASKEFVAGYEAQLGQEGEEVEESKRKEVIRGIATKVGEVGGALEGQKESGELDSS
jgi:hypothetical protein